MDIIKTGKQVLEIEAQAILKAKGIIGKNFSEAVQLFYKTNGRVVITGMGKSGLIGKKISATLTSTGTPSVFLHPAEAIHGDIGIINQDDTILALSSSGETTEVVRLLNLIKRIGVKIVSITGNPKSLLAKESNISLNFEIEKEACPTGLVPTTSTTLTLAIGDALCIALMEQKGFSCDDFKYYHPGGSIGKKLLKVRHLMHSGQDLPIVQNHTTLKEVLEVIDQKRFGVAIVSTQDLNVTGIITDGDIRRLLLKGIDFRNTKAVDCINHKPFTIGEDKLAVEGLKIMESKRITSLVVTKNNILKGLLHLHDLWRTEMI